MPWPGAYTACDKHPALEMTVDRKSILGGGTNNGKGEQLWQLYMVWGTIGGDVFGPAGPLAARTTYGVTVLWALPIPCAFTA